MSCTVGNCPVPTDLHLCHPHLGELEAALESIAGIPPRDGSQPRWPLGLVADLELSIGRQACVKSSPSTATKPLPMSRIGAHDLDTDRRILAQSAPISFGPMALRDQLVAQLHAAVNLLAAHVTYDTDPDPASAALWLRLHSDKVALLPDAGIICDGIGGIVKRCWRGVDTAPDRQYIGPCPECGCPMHAPIGVRRHWCLYCNGEVDAMACRVDLLRQMEDERLSVGGLLAVCSYAGLEVTRRKINYLVERGELASVGAGLDGYALYSVRDLADALARTGAGQLTNMEPSDTVCDVMT